MQVYDESWSLGDSGIANAERVRMSDNEKANEQKKANRTHRNELINIIESTIHKCQINESLKLT